MLGDGDGEMIACRNLPGRDDDIVARPAQLGKRHQGSFRKGSISRHAHGVTPARAIRDDLAWLGIKWETPVLKQSERFDAYRAALRERDRLELLYPSFLKRPEIAARIVTAQSQEAGWPRDLYDACLYCPAGTPLADEQASPVGCQDTARRAGGWLSPHARLEVGSRNVGVDVLNAQQQGPPVASAARAPIRRGHDADTHLGSARSEKRAGDVRRVHPQPSWRRPRELSLQVTQPPIVTALLQAGEPAA